MEPGEPEVLKLTEVPDPIPQVGQVHIEIKAFGLNRAEAVTRMGGSGKAVLFPKVIGIECVGAVLACPGGEYEVGQKVAAAMGGMGRKYNGSYAEQTVVPSANVFPLKTQLDWTILGSLPETYFTAWGCCFETLKIEEGAKVLVRPGASALGIAITQIVNHLGGEVIGVTRSAHKVDKLLKAGMKEVLVSGEAVAESVRKIWPQGADGVVDTIVSKTSIKDDLAIRKKGGRICLAGSLADSYGTSEAASFARALIRSGVSFFSSEKLHVEKDGQNLQTIVERVEEAVYNPCIDAVYDFEDLVEAHKQMEQNAFCGKVVIVL